MRDNGWMGFHVYGSVGAERVLAELIAPLVTDLPEHWGVAYFFLRYWNGGDHVRLRVRPGASADPTLVRQLIERRCLAYLAQLPEPPLVGTQEFADHATALARQEQLDEFTVEPYPPNTVAFAPYEREYRRYGGTECIDAVERHFVDSSRIALRFIRGQVPQRERERAAFAMVLVSWLCLADRRNPLGAAGSPGVVSEYYRANAPQLRAHVRRLDALASQGTAAPGNGVLAQWTRSVSELVIDLSGSEAVPRVVDSCAHMLCNRLGVSISAEQNLRYLAALSLAGNSDQVNGLPPGEKGPQPR